MRRVVVLGMVIGALAAASAAQAVDVCNYNVRYTLGVLCPIHTGTTVCLSQSAAIGACDENIRCYGGPGFFCQAELAPQSGPQPQCAHSSVRPRGLICYRPLTPPPVTTPSATVPPTLTPTATGIPTGTATATATGTNTALPTSTQTSAPATATASSTATLALTATATGTPTGTAAATATATATGVPTGTASATATATASATATGTGGSGLAAVISGSLRHAKLWR